MTIASRLTRLESRVGTAEMIIANPRFWPDSPPTKAEILEHRANVERVMRNPKGRVVFFDTPGQADPWGTMCLRKAQ